MPKSIRPSIEFEYKFQDSLMFFLSSDTYFRYIDGQCWAYFEMLPLKLMNKFTIHYPTSKWVFLSQLISETESNIVITSMCDDAHAQGWNLGIFH